MGFDFWFLPKGKVLGMFRYLRSRGLRLVTTHVGRNAYMGEFGFVFILLREFCILEIFLVTFPTGCL